MTIYFGEILDSLKHTGDPADFPPGWGQFERNYQTDPSSEEKVEIELKSIELSDHEILQKNMISREMKAAGFVYKPPIESEMSPALKEKFKLAKTLTKQTNIVDLGEKNAQDTRKSPKSKPKKNDRKSNKTAVARVQKEL